MIRVRWFLSMGLVCLVMGCAHHTVQVDCDATLRPINRSAPQAVSAAPEMKTVP
jgi:hypothetical protein